MRSESRPPALFICMVVSALACTGTEPSDQPADLPDLVFSQQDPASGLWSLYGHTEGRGSYEIVPGENQAPRPVHDFLLVRPTTGELLYVSGGPDLQYYVLLNPGSGEFREAELPGSVENWSPDGELLTTDFGGTQMVVTVEGALRATVCGPPVDVCGAPRWTAGSDGVLSWRRQTGGESDLWLVPLDGSAEVNLSQSADRSEIGPSQSPDGQHLVYERRPGFELVVSNPDGSDPQVLIAPVGLGSFPWSPDASTVAVEASVEGQSGLALVPLDGSPRVITPPDEVLVVVSQFAWSPDGSRLAYGAFEGPAYDNPAVFLINVDGSGRRQLSTPGQVAYRGTWMPSLP